MAAADCWVPLEANPEVMTRYAHRLGVPAKWSLVDVLGLDEEQLAWVPRPAQALLLLFPCSEAYERHKAEERARLEGEGYAPPASVFFMRQTVRNACGTFALVHAIANRAAQLELADGDLRKFIGETGGETPEARGARLAGVVAAAHADLAAEGQSRRPDADEPVVHHFVALVSHAGRLYELDGGKAFPIDHGPSSDETFLSDAARVCREFMARDPADVNFTVVALAAAD